MPQFIEIAKNIEEMIKGQDVVELPTAAELMKKYHASRATISRAMRIVKKNGLIESFGRGGIRVKGRIHEKVDTEETVKKTHSQLLFNQLSQGISNGTWLSGQPLPKIDFFCREHHLSARTVLKAYNALLEKSYVHRSGKKWIVGTETSQIIGLKTFRRPVIAVLLPAENTLQSLKYNVNRFSNRFFHECDQRQVRTFPVLASDNPPEHLSGILPCGQKGMARFIKNSGDDYIGSVVFGNDKDIPGLGSWLHTMASFEKPVVVIDTEVQPAPAKEPFYGRNVYYCHPDFSGAVRLTLTTLDRYSNRCIGMVRVFYNVSPRMQGLIDEFTRQGPAFNPPFTVDVEQEAQFFWRLRPDGQLPADVIRRLREKGIPVVRKILDSFINTHPDIWKNPILYEKYPRFARNPIMGSNDMKLIYQTHVLVPIFKRSPVTALIALSDVTAVGNFYWLQALGIKVPQQVSLIGFDNGNIISPLPVTCLDWGYDHLGYMVFHLIRGDLPIKTRKDNLILTPVSLVDRGSVGASSGVQDLSCMEGDIR